MRGTPAIVVCLSHLRWNFVFQRPQHLLSRCAQSRPVVFFEEPVFDGGSGALELRRDGNVLIATPHFAPGTSVEVTERRQRVMLDRLLADLGCSEPVLWFYTPMPVTFTQHLRAKAIVYDCMDELSLFQGAPPELGERERKLFALADVVFTGGHSLYRHKMQTAQHANIHPFPSSVDIPHFATARELRPDPTDQAAIGRPRIGYFGVIDERIDLELIDRVAVARPDWQFVMLGPVVKIDPAALPRRDNIHYLGNKPYTELPSYLAGWDVAIMPFARNDATRFISPTKTPEYLAAGKPVVSTSITDVVTPYGREGLVWIADTPGEFEAAIDVALTSDRSARLAHADAFLAEQSWNRTWAEMWSHVEQAIAMRGAHATTQLSAGGTANSIHAREED